MKQSRIFVPLASLLLLAFGSTGCVDQEPSMQLSGSILFQGSVNQQEEETTIECDVEVDPTSIESFSTRGSIDITDFIDDGKGQFGPPFPTDVSTTTISQSPTHNSFVFWAAIQNRLADSTEVGAEGQGGGSGGYTGLELDQNAIQVTSAEIEFPSDLNSFPGGGGAADRLNKTVNFSAVIPSSGGGAVVHFPIFTDREIRADLKPFYDGVVSGQQDIVPLVAEIQIKGETFAGTKVESNKLRFPIDICGSCDPGQGGGDQFTTSPTCDMGGGGGGGG